MKVVFREPKKAGTMCLAEATLVEVFPGRDIGIRGFSVLQGTDGPWVTLPSRQYQGRDGQKKYEWFVFPLNDNPADLNVLRSFILSEYAKWREQNPLPSEGEGEGGGYEEGEVPFA